MQGHARGLAKGLARGHARGLVRGHANSRAKGLARGHARGHARHNAKGHARRNLAKGLARGSTWDPPFRGWAAGRQVVTINSSRAHRKMTSDSVHSRRRNAVTYSHVIM